MVARIQCELLEKLRGDREWDLGNCGLDEVRHHITRARYDEASIDRQMEKLEVPEVWTPVGLESPFWE